MEYTKRLYGVDSSLDTRLIEGKTKEYEMLFGLFAVNVSVSSSLE
jgi:hypothetical protein